MPASKRSSSARGYGVEHQRLRAELLPHAYGTTCHLCGHVMQYGQALDLDHTPDRTAYRGMVHASCNRRDGARRGNRMRKRKLSAPSRDW